MPPTEQLIEFFSNHSLLVAALFGSFMLLVFSEIHRRARASTDVAPLDAVRLMNAEATVIDVRGKDAFDRGHLVNAKNIPMDAISPDNDKLKSLSDQPLIMACDTGMTAHKAAMVLRRAGFSNVLTLKGGLTAWQQENLPLVSSGNAKRKSKKGKG